MGTPGSHWDAPAPGPIPTKRVGMKKTTVIFCFIALLGVAYWTHASMLMVTGQGAVAAGNVAAGVYRPNADVSIGSWTDNDFETSNLYSDIDDAVTTGTAGDGAIIHEWETGTIYEAGFPEITGTISSLRVHIRCAVSGSVDPYIDISISQNGSTWSAAQQISCGASDAQSWTATTFSGLSWTDTTDLRARLDAVTLGQVYQVDVLYIEANP